VNKKIQADVREWLRDQPDGASVSELMQVLGRDRATIAKELEIMPDAYIDRWRAVRAGDYEAVWCVVPVPEHCPHPDAEVAA